VATPTKLAVLLHADIEGSTSLVRLDETLAHERFHRTFRRFSAVITEWDGIPHEIRGDAIVAEFQRASDAANAAMAFQSDNQIQIADIADAVRPQMRVGIALGEVIIADGTVTGAGVVLAQRLEQLANPGGVCISAAIREALPDRLPFRCEDLGRHELKGIGYPQQVYSLSEADNERVRTASDAPEQRNRSDQRASIVVLPFDNLSADAEQEFFVDGITGDIITGLSNFKELVVIARSTAFTFKGKSIDVGVLSKQLNVRYVLEGSIRRLDNRVRVSAQLVDARTTSQIWGNRFDRTLGDLFDLQDELTEAVVTAVAPQIVVAESEHLRRVQPNSYDAWSLVQFAQAKIRDLSKDSMDEAFELLNRAIEIDPGYARAYAWLSMVGEARHRVFGSPDDVSRTREWGETAVKFDPQDAMCHTALGSELVFSGEMDKGITVLKTALRLNPSFTLAHETIGVGYLRRGEPELALDHAEYALRLSPYDLRAGHSYMLKGVALRRLGRFEQAIENSRMAAHLMPEMPLAQIHHAITCALGEHLEEGRAALERARDIGPKLTISNFRRWRGFAEGFADESSEGLRKLGVPEH
jgi:adenylate cyclase